MAFASLSDLVKSFESNGGNYTILNYRYDATHTASGAYQFTDTTWRRFAGAIGVDLSQYPKAYLAPPDVQDSVFAKAVATVGLQPWTCDGCNAPLTNYLAANPGAANLPAFNAGGSTALSSVNDTGASASWFDGSKIVSGLTTLGKASPYDFITNPLGTVAGAATSSGVVNTGAATSAVLAWLLSSRVALAVLAIVFIAGAILLLAIRSGISVETARA